MLWREENTVVTCHRALQAWLTVPQSILVVKLITSSQNMLVPIPHRLGNTLEVVLALKLQLPAKQKGKQGELREKRNQFEFCDWMRLGGGCCKLRMPPMKTESLPATVHEEEQKSCFSGKLITAIRKSTVHRSSSRFRAGYVRGMLRRSRPTDISGLPNRELPTVTWTPDKQIDRLVRDF